MLPIVVFYVLLCISAEESNNRNQTLRLNMGVCTVFGSIVS